MIILGLDTTGADCSACVVRGDKVVAYISEPIGRGHAERLAPMVVEVLAAAGVTPDEIDRIAVCTGPGSFTGLRVALSFAKGFALPRKTPVLGFSAMSVAYLENEPEQVEFKTVYKDAKRGQVMFGNYGSAYALSTDDPKLGTLDDMKSEADLLQFDIIEVGFVDVRVMAKAAMTLDPDDFPAVPLYARAPDAKLPGGLTPKPQSA